MRINNDIASFKGLVPISKYKGPILKLTESDKKKIKLYQNKISQMELDLAKFHSLLKRQFTSSNCNYYYDKITCCEYQISVLKDLIREIKLKRFNEQKKSQNLDLQG